MKKELLIILILLLPSAYSMYNLSIYKGTVTSDTPFMINDKSYRMVYIRYANNTIIYYPENITDVIYNNESCSEEWIYRACVNSVKFMKNGREMPHDVHESNVDAVMSVEIFYSPTGLSLTRTIEKTDFYSGEEAEATLVLSNIGDVEVTDINLKESIPEGVMLISGTGCTIGRDSISWYGSMDRNGMRKCTYRLRMLSPGRHTLAANATYTVLDKAIAATDIKTVNVMSSPLNVTVSSMNITATPGNTTTLQLNLTAEKDLSVSFMISLPGPLIASSYSQGLTSTAKGLKWSGTISKGQMKQFNLTVSSRLVDTYAVNYSLDYEFDSIHKEWRSSTIIDVATDTFYAMTIEREDSTVLRIINPTQNTFYAVQVNANADNFSAELSHDMLSPKSHKEFVLPKLSGKQTYSIRYRTEHGQYLSLMHEAEKTALSEVPIEGIAIGPEENTESTPSPENKNEDTEFSIPLLPVDKINWKLILIPSTVILVIFLFFSFIAKRKNNDLDKDIKELQKQMKE